ncbi:MAG: cytochrome c oxidase subunit II [Fimbriimonadaceae bacterium]|nr:cytochrome c oxidase subunit II [Fimbriimonadaceae bacterium]
MNLFRGLPIYPEPASENALRYDLLFWTITLLSFFFFVLVGGLALYFVAKYRSGSNVVRSNPMDHHTGLEILWSGIPILLALAVFAWSTNNFVNHQRRMPKDALEVFVIGKRWMWHLQHMNGIRENNELHVPVGTPVKMTMISQDVIHAMYLPDFRAQFHVVPGRYTELHFTPTKVGRFKMLCAMHCGTKHSEMVGFVHVMEKAEFARWLENGGNRNIPVALDMKERGAQVWAEKNCGNCHGDSDNVRGPSLAGLMGSKRQMTDGTTVLADRTYVRDSITAPWRQITQGYRAEMPEYSNLTEPDILALTAFIESLTKPSGEAPADALSPRDKTRPLTSADDNVTDIANKYGKPVVGQQQLGGSRK